MYRIVGSYEILPILPKTKNFDFFLWDNFFVLMKFWGFLFFHIVMVWLFILFYFLNYINLSKCFIVSNSLVIKINECFIISKWRIWYWFCCVLSYNVVKFVNQYTNLCFNIPKIFFFIYNFISYACTCILIDWFFLECSLIVVEWYNLNSWVWNYILMSFAALIYKYIMSTQIMKWMMMIRNLGRWL